MTQAEKLRLIIVEDDHELIDLLTMHLHKVGMKTTVFDHGLPFLQMLPDLQADLIILDVNLPDASGYDIMKSIESSGRNIPVIFLTGRGAEKEKVKGLDSGADDYITKPFSPRELLARIRAVIRRNRRLSEAGIFTGATNMLEVFDFNGAQVCPKSFTVTFPNGAVEKVGKKELGILAVMNHNNGQVISRMAIIRSVWGEKANPRSRSLDQYVVKLRNLFEKHGCDISNLRTVHGVGYAYNA